MNKNEIYDKAGRFLGRIKKVGTKTNYYDNKGSLTDFTIEKNNRDDVYSGHGDLLGRMPKHSNPLFPFDDKEND